MPRQDELQHTANILSHKENQHHLLFSGHVFGFHLQFDSGPCLAAPILNTTIPPESDAFLRNDFVFQ